MAANFKIGQEVKLITNIPQGPVKQLSVSQNGDIEYLVEWVEGKETNERWFKEDELDAV